MNFVRAAGFERGVRYEEIKEFIINADARHRRVFSACAKEDSLETPTNLAVDVDNNLTWSEISGARTYTVEVTNVSSEEKEEKA